MIITTQTIMGTINVGSIVVTQDSLNIDQLVDVDAAAPVHNDLLMYNDTLQDVSYTTGWHAKPLLLESMENVNTDTLPVHNEIIVWNDFATDPSYPDGFVNKDISAVFSNLGTIVKSIVNVQNSVMIAEGGDLSKTDQVMFTAGLAATGVVNVAVVSCEDNNALYKKEITDTDYVFVQNLDKGILFNTTYTAGTFFRSDKGLTGFSGPALYPLCPSACALKEARFYIQAASATITCVSMGTDCEITVYQSDGITVESGPTSITSYNIATMAVAATGEYFIKATGFVACGIAEVGDINLRYIVPMKPELIGWNTNCFITAQEASTTVTYHRRNNTTGTIAVSAGTTVDGTGTFGSNGEFAPGGGIILRSDNPISAVMSDGTDSQAISLMPVSMLSQCFGIPATIGSVVATYGVAGIFVVSPYEGTAIVYDNTGTLVNSFNFNRSGAISPPIVTTDQLYPASQRWAPGDDTLPALVGGYIETNVPAMIVVNVSEDTVWTGSVGKEIPLSGSTPESHKAEIRLDADGFARRRDMDNAGVVTWNVC